MIVRTAGRAAVMAGLLSALGACHGAAPQPGNDSGIVFANALAADGGSQPASLDVTVTGAKGRHDFRIEVAGTAAAQERGLMYRTDIPADGGMLFWPYPPEGGAPRTANFWMKNTPSALDIVFIRADGTIARIAENTVPMSEAIVSSEEPVTAILELKGGRTAELGIDQGDKVSWPGQTGG